jgi:hypothetical protein
MWGCILLAWFLVRRPSRSEADLASNSALNTSKQPITRPENAIAHQ